MRIVDAGVVIEMLTGRLDPGLLGDEELAAPHLVDSEVTHVLRSLVRRGDLTEAHGDIAMEVFIALAITRFSADGLLPRMWELRHNLSGYGATYVALAEATSATALLTTDARLARAPGLGCVVQLL